MIKVVKIDKFGTEREMLLENAVWERIVKTPNLVPGTKWRLWKPTPKPTTKFVEVPIDAEVQILKAQPEKSEPIDRVEPEKPTVAENAQADYGESEYKNDMILAKKLMKEGDNEGARDAFRRALVFKPKNPYIKAKLKTL